MKLYQDDGISPITTFFSNVKKKKYREYFKCLGSDSQTRLKSLGSGGWSRPWIALGLAVNNYSITLGLTAKSVLRALVLGPVGRPDPITLGHVGLPDQTILGPTNPSFFSKAIGSW
jgi:hypothetical protein